MITQTIENMPDASRLWVYQSNRPFLQEEKVQVEILIQNFLGQWAAHGQELFASFKIEYDQFIIIAVDESHHSASGCSIDASVGLIRNLEKEFEINLLDRTQVATLNGERLKVYPFSDVKKMITEGHITSDTLVFNNAIQNVGEWKRDWKQPAAESWMKRFF